VFYTATNVTVYYLPGTTGWRTTFGVVRRHSGTCPTQSSCVPARALA